jgi:hypothetical protein
MMKRWAQVVAAGAVVAGMAAPAAEAKPSREQAFEMYKRVCEKDGGTMADNPGPLDCVKYQPTGFSNGALGRLQRLCEQTLGGTFQVRVVTEAHAYCFLD